MIFDNIDCFNLYRRFAPEAWDKIYPFLQQCNATTPDGRYSIDGEAIYGSVQSYRTKSLSGAQMELHHQYADIQVVLSGEESIFCQEESFIKLVKPYDGKKDIAFYSFEEANLAELQMIPGRFLLFLPRECHMPGIGEPPREVKKLVIKISRELLT